MYLVQDDIGFGLNSDIRSPGDRVDGKPLWPGSEDDMQFHGSFENDGKAPAVHRQSPLDTPVAIIGRYGHGRRERK